MIGNSFLHLCIIGKVYDTLTLFLGILYRLVRPAALVLDTAHDKV